MIFTRSRVETGATTVVHLFDSQVSTIFVYIVQLAKAKDYYFAAIVSFMLIIIALVMLLVINMIMRGEKNNRDKEVEQKVW
ncbi:MAG: hypothetical protein QW735_04180 [archaeon]